MRTHLSARHSNKKIPMPEVVDLKAADTSRVCSRYSRGLTKDVPTVLCHFHFRYQSRRTSPRRLFLYPCRQPFGRKRKAGISNEEIQNSSG